MSRPLIYGALILWAFICLFPIYWTITTSFKLAPNVMQGHLIPFVDYTPKWKGWESLTTPEAKEDRRSVLIVDRDGSFADEAGKLLNGAIVVRERNVTEAIPRLSAPPDPSILSPN